MCLLLGQGREWWYLSVQMQWPSSSNQGLGHQVLLGTFCFIVCSGKDLMFRGAKRHPQMIARAVLVNLPSKLEVQDISETHIGCACEHASGQD